MITNRKKPEKVIIYGRTLNAYNCIQGLLHRGVKPENIYFVMPDEWCHVEDFYGENDPDLDLDLPIINPNAFEDEYIEEKIHRMLEVMGITIYKHCKIMKIVEDEKNHIIKSVVFKRLDIPAISPEEEEEEDEMMGRRSDSDMDGEGDEMGEGEDDYMPKKRKRNELELNCRLMITCGHRDVDPAVFHAIHSNGLVYNGRLIVDKNFQTTDPSIFAAGSLTEFSGRYKSMAMSWSLKMDRYNGREMGSRLARSVFDIYDPTISAAVNEQSSL